MIVQMRTVAQAQKAAAATGGVHLPDGPRRDGVPRLSRSVDLGVDFEVYRGQVEAVSVLFKLFDDSGGEPVEVASGWTATAAKFEVDWPAEPDRAALVRSHFGARRFAFNWGLAQVKADLDAKPVDPAHQYACSIR
jgi:putative transposase